MLRYARVLLVLMLIAAVGGSPRVLAQDEDELEETIAELEEELDDLRDELEELEEDNDSLREENRDLRDENSELRDEIDVLEERVEELDQDEEDRQDDGGNDGDVPPQSAIDELAGTWVKSSSTAESKCGVFSCAWKFEWNDLELGADLTYRWGEAPYDEGVYEVYERYGEGEVANLDVVLIGSGGERCYGNYDYVRDSLDFIIVDCPGIFVENTEGDELVELNAGFVGFVPGRDGEENDSPVNDD